MYGPKKDPEDEPKVYIDAGGFVHSTPQAAVEASLLFEETSNTGAGCGQDPEYVDVEEGDSE